MKHLRLLMTVMLALLLAACQPEPVDPQADEVAGAELLARYEAARAGGDYEVAEMHGNQLDQSHGKTEAAATMRETYDDVVVQADAMRERRRLIGLWDYQSVAVDGGTQHSAAIYSKVPAHSLEEGGPAPRPEARLVLRRHPEWGESAYLVLQMSSLRCGPPCRLKIRFDDGPVREFSGDPADTGTGPALFIEDEPGFLAAMSQARRVRFELPRNGVLVPTFEFEVGGYRPELYRGGKD